MYHGQAAGYILATFLIPECCKTGIKVEPTLGKAIKNMTFYVGKEYRIAQVLFLNCFFWNITQALCFPRHAFFSLLRSSKVILLTSCSLKEEFQYHKSVIERKIIVKNKTIDEIIINDKLLIVGFISSLPFTTCYRSHGLS